jgi:anaerobic selenocysteine-containing dehydrogenase
VKVYKIDIAGVEHTVQLSDEDAKARGLTAGDEASVETKKAAEPANKARKAAANKAPKG